MRPASASRQMFPRSPVHDRLDIMLCHAEAARQTAKRLPRGSQPADLKDAWFRELGMAPRIDRPGAVPMGIVGVRLIRIPPQVLDPVVRRIAVVVAADEPLRARTHERLQHESVDEPAGLLAVTTEVDHQMTPAALDRMEGHPGIGHPSRTSIAGPTGLDLPVSADSVAGIIRNWAEEVVHRPM